MNDYSLRRKTVSGLLWSYMERVGTQAVQFLVSLILARILMPDDYGVIAIVLVFINICDVFVQGGMGTALIQKKEVDECDYSSVFYFSLSISTVLFLLLFFSAPFIAQFYKMPILTGLLQVLGFRMPISSFLTVQRAIVARNMNFRKFFTATIISVFFSAIIGVWMAKHGYGVWSLAVQNISNSLLNVIVLFFIVKWYPRLLFSWNRTKTLFSFGWKLLMSNLIDAIYEDFRSLYVGKLYTPAELAFYNQGLQFPRLVGNNINTSITTALFPALATKQDDMAALKNITRRSITISSFIMMPMMFILAAISESLVVVLLTEKWIGCVPFVQILCFNFALLPIHSANMQAILAMGRSDLNLRMSLIKKTSGFIIILITASYSVLAMAWGGILIGIIASIVNSYPNKRLLNYGYFDQLRDIMPYVLLSTAMCIPVLLIPLLSFSPMITLFLQFVTGVISYVTLSYIYSKESLFYIISIIKEFGKK